MDLVALFFLFAAADSEPVATARKIAASQVRLPWFGPPDAEGLSDIPYAREESIRRAKPRPRGSPLSDWTSITFERIPLEWGSEIRCLEFDGKAPCPDEWIEELKKQSARRDGYSADRKAETLAQRQQRRDRRRAFWEKFADEMAISRIGPDRLRFQPRPGRTGPRGELTYDPATFEITSMKTDGFSIRLEKLIDNRYMPARMETDKPGRRVTEFRNFRRFEAETTLQFEDKEGPAGSAGPP